MREVEEDIAEGADLIIAKPAMAYMDIITEIRRNYNIPIVAYNVSGEYSMVKAAAANGWIDEKKLLQSAEHYGKSPYGQHLRNVVEDKIYYK